MFGLEANLNHNFSMSHNEFEYFRTRIMDLAGISLSPAKRDLVQGRLRQRVQSLNLKSFSEYQSYLETLPKGHEEWEAFVNLLTTNKTDWFREPKHFSFIVQEFLPRWLKLGKNHLNIWCAASSTGEEPYTLALVLNKALKSTGITYTIHATDIDTNVLSVAKNGVYPKSQLDQIPEEFHKTGFCFGTEEISPWMKVRKEIKSPVIFKRVNLVSDSYDLPSDMDLILCRNVFIYFNKETIKRVVQNMHEMASKNAILLIAHSETIQNIDVSWKYLSPSIYQKGNLL